MEQHEDPLNRGGQTLAQIIAAAAMGAEAYAQHAERQARERAERYEQELRRVRERYGPDAPRTPDPEVVALPDAVALDPQRLQQWSDRQDAGLHDACYPEGQVITGEVVAIAAATTAEDGAVITTAPPTAGVSR